MKEKKIKSVNKLKLVGIILMLALLFIVIARIVNHAAWKTDVVLSDEGLKHSDRFENSIVLNGIDVSAYQGTEIQWKKVKSSGADFAFIRAGYRGTEKGKLMIDETFGQNADEAKKAGLMVGAYYYSQALTPAEAREEAEKLLDIVDGREMDLPLVIDFEIFRGGRLDNKIQEGEMNYAQAYHDIVLAFCKTVEDAGYDSAIYANTDMFTHYMDAKLIDKESNLWVADFGRKCTLDAGYRFWQCSDSSEVGGTEHTVDHDIMYLNAKGNDVNPSGFAVTRVYSADAKKRTSMEECSIKLKKNEVKHKYSGAKVKLNVVDKEGRKMRSGKDYTVSYVKNMKPGTGYAVVRGINGYRDIIIAPYTIK